MYKPFLATLLYAFSCMSEGGAGGDCCCNLQAASVNFLRRLSITWGSLYAWTLPHVTCEHLYNKVSSAHLNHHTMVAETALTSDNQGSTLCYMRSV
jgi:hypothetical protein